ncbi:MAG TPA: sugar phosphate isomerase/epimerase [Cyclobacteriaceae bacterium]|jgi:sugar phosphate isomerase/epimerase
MRNNFFQFLILIVIAAACSGRQSNETTQTEVPDWKLGVAFWTFHTFKLPDALDKIDSSGVEYVEGVTFFNAGAELGDSIIGVLSNAGLAKVRAMLDERGLKMESMYVGGDRNIESWKRQFDVAKFFNVKYVTGEPPVAMLDEIDSLLGAYDLRMAIHEHWRGVSQYWHPDSVLAAIEGHKNFGACADLGHWPKSGVNPLDGVKRLEGHIMGIHLKDIAEYNNPNIQDVRVGTGVVDFPAIFAELKRQNFSGHIYIERDAETVPSNLLSVLETIEYYNEQVARLGSSTQ